MFHVEQNKRRAPPAISPALCDSRRRPPDARGVAYGRVEGPDPKIISLKVVIDVVQPNLVKIFKKIAKIIVEFPCQQLLEKSHVPTAFWTIFSKIMRAYFLTNI